MAATKVARRKPQGPAEDTAAFGPIAERFRRAGDLERAVSLCRDGLQKFPETVSARVTLGWALLELGKLDEARTELETALRRAPDNLSAIRGLAELHDRAEHSMDLSMDGPGQWPPDAEALDQLDQPSAKAGEIVDDAVWAPVDGATEATQADLSAPAYAAPPEMGLAMWSAVEPESAPTSGSGMSSVREIDPDAGADALAAALDQATVETPHTTAFDQVAANAVASEPEVDLAALIAEADSLEAVADGMARDRDQGAIESAEPTLVLEAGVDLAAFEEADPVVDVTDGFDAPVELTAGSDAFVEPELVSPPVVIQPEPEPELIVVGTAEVTEVAVAAGEVTEVSEVVELVEVAEAAEVEMPVAAYEAAAPMEPAFILTAPDEFTSSWSLAELASAEAYIDGGVTEMHAEPVEFAQALDFETVPEPVAEVVAPVVASEVVAPALAEVVAFAKVAEAVSVQPERKRSPVPALERFLAGVHARRRQLMAESVA